MNQDKVTVKPICVIYYLEQIFQGGRNHVSEINEDFRKAFPDYHVLAIPSRMSLDGSCEDLRLEVFHPKDFTEANYQELKELVLNHIKETNQ